MTVAETTPARSTTATGTSTVLVPGEPRQIAVVAAHAHDLDQVAKQLRGLAMAGHRVVLVWWQGEPSERLAPFGARVRVGDAPRAGGLRGRAKALLDRRSGGPSLGNGSNPLVTALRGDARATRILESSDALVLAGATALSAADELTTPDRPLVAPDELVHWEAVSGIWVKLAAQLEKGQRSVDEKYLRSLLRQLALLGGSVPAQEQPLLARVVEILHRRGDYDRALDLAQLLDDDVPRQRGLRALTATSASGTPYPQLGEVVRDLVAAADRS